MASFDVITLTRGPVPADDRAYAEEKLLGLEKVAPRPIVKARLKLTVREIPHIATPAIAQANLDISDGHFVRIRIEAGTIREAADLLVDRAGRKLRRIGDRYQSRRHTNGDAWHHGDAPSTRPSYFPRDPDDRDLVRRKSIGTAESTIDEAAFDMSQLDYDFFIFTDVETGGGALLFHKSDGEELALRYANGAPAERPKYASLVKDIDPTPAPRLSTDDAFSSLEEGNLPFVFFTDTDTGDPSVAYHRYDGHYGLLTARG
jgi:ribosome-associated translation inhibitor RaiA